MNTSDNKGAKKSIEKKQAKATSTPSVPFEEVEEDKSDEVVPVEAKAKPANKPVEAAKATPEQDNETALDFLTTQVKAMAAQIEKLESDKTIAANPKFAEAKTIQEDTLDDPAVFFTFSVSHGLFGDRKKNRDMPTPDGKPYIFRNLTRYNKPKASGRGVTTISVSQCTEYSLERANYMRNHSLFGIKYFESVSEAKTIDVTLADKMAMVSGMVRNLTDHEVIRRAGAQGIDVSSPDVSVIRRDLIRTIAMNDIKSNKDKYQEEIARLTDVDGRLTLLQDKTSSIPKQEMNPEVQY